MSYLSKEESLFLKGFAILCIALHNFVRVVESIDCNEFAYYQESTEYMLANFTNRPFFVICSFWGWLGVPLFVFISGYGLQKTYKDNIGGIFSYIFNHFFKLILLLIPAYVVYVLYFKFTSPEIDYGKTLMIEHLTLTINILNPKFINPGVYWYFGMAMQLYLFFLLLRRCSNYVLYAIIWTIPICLQIFVLDDSLLNNLIYIRHNSIGWIHLFVMGMLFARSNKTVVFNRLTKVLLLITSLVSIVVCSLSSIGWPLVEIIAVQSLLLLLPLLKKLAVLKFVGAISASLYVVHPVLRIIWKNTFNINYSNQNIMIASSVAFLLLSISVSWAYSYYFNQITGRIRRVR